ncbi:Proteasome-activating nucleotidase [Candidatus Gugararchaeum adminiculabundum]|nr:Proteasome-activating nucleotidase [Candidatus Gugararchaeum adminiculabundum]
MNIQFPVIFMAAGDEGKPNPTDARTYYHKGNAYYEKGNYDKAIENYNMTIVLNPNFSEAYFNRGLAYYNKKNFDKSIEDYARAAELDPRNPVIYNNRGDAYYRKQEFDKAIVDYDRALKLNPRYLKAFYNRGLAYACQQDYERAIKDFDKVIELNPNFSEAWHIRGLAYDYMQNYDKAIENYDKAIELNPNFTEAINHRELAKAKKERGPDAGGGAPGTDATGGAPQQGQGTVNVEKLIVKSNANFTNVAGMEKLKEELREAIVYPLMQPELARKYGKLGGGGIMLYGPPGCGKTFIMKAAAGEAKVTFINAKISDILDMYVGNTEKNLHAIFEGARKHTPCILFFDEMEALGGRREDMGGSAQYLKMAVNALLYEMDGVEAKNENVLVIGATNAPWDVDPALRRSGRFGKSLFVPEPDFRSRVAILKLNCKKRPTGRIDFRRIARCTIGFSSADLKAIVDEAASIPWREAFKTGHERPVVTRDFIVSLKKKKSTLPPWYAQANKQIGNIEERSIIDGKEHVKISESKLGPAEKEQFKQLLDVIKKNNKLYYKIYKWVMRNIPLYLPIPNII